MTDKKKIQPLVEDAEAIELDDGTIRKTHDRKATAEQLRESESGPKPAHPEIREEKTK